MKSRWQSIVQYLPTGACARKRDSAAQDDRRRLQLGARGRLGEKAGVPIGSTTSHAELFHARGVPAHITRQMAAEPRLAATGPLKEQPSPG